MKKLIGPFKQVITMDKLPMKGNLLDEQMEVIENGGILIEGENILEIGKFLDLESKADSIEKINGEQIALPGFIDSHTHICFGGSRAKDYGMRLEGKTYLEIAKNGGGIWSTVTKTREASQEELAEKSIQRIEKLLRQGVTTVESKSGYGLSVEEELKILRAIKDTSESTKIDVIPTCLGAHMLPKDFEGTHREYLDLLLTDLLPKVKEENLANRVDAFIEELAFNVEDSKYYLSKAKEMGFEITVHADQFTTGGSEIAINLGAVSADHLENSTDKEVELFKNSDCVAVALPGASIGLAMQYTPARKILDGGACLSIASDWNPGSAPMGNLLLQACLLGVYEKLTITETLAGITFRAAKALNLNDRGIIKKGNIADIISFPTNDYKEIVYQQGGLEPNIVWKKGEKLIK